MFGQAVSKEGISVPENPREPSVDFTGLNEVADISVSKAEIRVNISGSGEEIYTMIIPRELSEFEIYSKDFKGTRKIFFKDLTGLEIKEWAGILDKSGAFVFYPDKYVLTLKSGEKINAEKKITLFNIIKIESKGGSRFLYTYFYDYYKKGIWVNRDVKSPDPVSTLPVNGCVTGFKVN